MTIEEAEEVCNVVPEIMFYLETSAKENTNVELAFARIAEDLMVMYYNYLLTLLPLNKF